MKSLKRLTLLVLVILPSLSGFSQFTFGPKVGFNFSNLFDHSTLQPGFDAGIFFRMGRGFYFQPEVDYSFRSTTFRGALDEIPENFKLKTHNIDIPLLVGFKFINNPNFNFRVFIGPRVGIMIDNSIKEPRADNPVSTIQIGGQAGIGIDFWRFTLDAKYDFSANRYDNGTEKEWWKQNMFNIALGFKILKN